MPLITSDMAFDLVHVGKCGGISVVVELQAHGFRFDHVHMRRPTYAADRRYVVLVRDPVSRFVSAFNWRKHLLGNDLLPGAHTADAIGRLRHRAERELLAEFQDVNAFAERLTCPTGFDVSALSTLMQLIGHVPQGFSWYLDDLLAAIAPGQLAGVIATERLADDFAAMFGFRLVAENHRHYASSGSTVSPVGRANLAREFRGEYRTLGRLADLARQAGVPMSMRYDPAVGAVPA